MLVTAPEVVKGRVFAPLKGERLVANPEEMVRQSFVLHLNSHYSYSYEQMAQERRTQAGRRSPKADILIWETEDQKR